MLRDLALRLVQAVDTGDVRGEIELRGRLAAELTSLGNVEGALAELGRLRQAADRLGSTHDCATAWLVEGRLRTTTDPEQAGRCVRRGLHMAMACGAQQTALRCHRALASLASNAGDLANTELHSECVVALAQQLADRRAACEALVALALCAVQRGDGAQAQKTARVAGSTARELGDPALVEQVELLSRAIALADGRWAPAITTSAAGRASSAVQDAGMHLAAGHLDEGIRAADVARQCALNARSAQLYLTACMFLANGHEQRGDRVAVLRVLLTCRASLKRTFGPAWAAAAQVLLTGATDAWGSESTSLALAQYRQMISDESEIS